MKTYALTTVYFCCTLAPFLIASTLATPMKRFTCHASHCLNGGTCERPGSALCSCPQPFFGSRCQYNSDTQGFCRLSPCQNGGTCYQWGVEKSDFYCFCDEPYYGELCQYDWGIYDPCAAKPCKDTEKCVPFGTQPTEFECFKQSLP